MTSERVATPQERINKLRVEAPNTGGLADKVLNLIEAVLSFHVGDQSKCRDYVAAMAVLDALDEEKVTS